MKRISFEGVKKVMNKRVLTMAGVCLLLVGAIIANVVISNNKEKEATEVSAGETNEPQQVSSGGSENFFEAYRLERDSVRTQELAYLDAIVAQGADDETLSDAQQQKLTLIENMETELTVEGLLKAKGFSDAIVSLHAGSVNVIVGAETLSDEEVAQILDIVLRETGQKAENVSVLTSESAG
ncbi:MAG: SpoIIIAH-like family protein [Clostridia bacterium]|nr:SpoIIIAH-like family protein [Clostridia bacterium]